MRVVFVPPVPALLPEYSQRQDPVRELRTACTEAVEWLLAGGARQVVVLHDPLEPEESARGCRTHWVSGSPEGWWVTGPDASPGPWPTAISARP